MNIIFPILCFIIAFFAYKRYNALYNPISLYLGIWAFVFSLYTLNPYSLPQIKEPTCQIYLTAFASFLIGYWVKRGKISFSLSNKPHRFLNKKVFNILIGIMGVFMIIPALNAMGLIFSGADLHDIRYVHHDSILGNGIVAVVFGYFCEPFIAFLIIYSVVNLFTGRKKKYYILLSVISLLLITVITGGRFYVLYFLASLLINTLIFRKSAEAKQILKYSRVLLILMVLSLIVISIIRGSDIVQTFFVYPSGCIPFMEERLAETSGLPNMFGLASLYGFIRPVFVVLRALFSLELPLPIKIVEAIFLGDDELIMLTPEVHYNSFVSIFYSMYLDGGLVGVAIGNLLLGVISKIVFVNLSKNDIFILSAYTLIGIIFLLSFFRFLVCSYTYALSFIYLYTCFSRRKSTT